MTNKFCNNKKCLLYNFPTVNGKFCTHCGSGLVNMSECKYCGVQLAPNTNFCADCGKPSK